MLNGNGVSIRLSTGSLAFWVAVVTVLLAGFVAYGWWLLLEELIPYRVVAILAAAAMTAIALLLARFFAQKRAAKKVGDSEKFRWWHGWPTYIFLFIISALGTVNAAFVLFEGNSIVRQDVSELRVAYGKIETWSQANLRSKDFDEKGEKLKGLLVALEREIDNPNGGRFCGVGSAANAILADIRSIVPSMPLIRGTGIIRPCDSGRAQRVYKAYEESALAALAADPDFSEDNGPAKYKYLADLEEDTRLAEQKLDEIVGALVTPNSFKSPLVQGGLEQIAGRYQTSALGLEEFVERLPAGVPQQVDVSQSQELGSFAAVLDLLWQRILYPSTWLYLFIALLFDFAIVWLLTETFVRFAEADPPERIDKYRDPKSGLPKFLWVAPQEIKGSVKRV